MEEHAGSGEKHESPKPGTTVQIILRWVGAGLFVIAQAAQFDAYHIRLALGCLCAGVFGFAMGYQPQPESPGARTKALLQELLAQAFLLIPLAFRLAGTDDWLSAFATAQLAVWLRFIRILVLLLSVLLLMRVIAMNAFRNRYPNEAVIHPAPEQVEEEEEDEPQPEVDPAHQWFLQVGIQEDEPEEEDAPTHPWEAKS